MGLRYLKKRNNKTKGDCKSRSSTYKINCQGRNSRYQKGSSTTNSESIIFLWVPKSCSTKEGCHPFSDSYTKKNCSSAIFFLQKKTGTKETPSVSARVPAKKAPA